MLSALQPTELFINSDQHWKKYCSVNFWRTLLLVLQKKNPNEICTRLMKFLECTLVVFPHLQFILLRFRATCVLFSSLGPEARTFNREIYISGCLCYVKFSSSVPPTAWFICRDGNVTEFNLYAVSIVPMNGVSYIGKLWNKNILLSCEAIDRTDWANMVSTVTKKLKTFNIFEYDPDHKCYQQRINKFKLSNRHNNKHDYI